jgi:branched-chain amino acid transport system substrate-binding protein
MMRDVNVNGATPFVALVAAVALTAGASQSAEKKYWPGVSDNEIKIGQTIAYSGPASSFGTTGHTISAYYHTVGLVIARTAATKQSRCHGSQQEPSV